MMSKMLYFLLGAAIGAGGSWIFLKNKYEKKADEEIESVKELYKRMFLSPGKDKEEKKEKPETETKDEKETAVRFNSDKGDIKDFVEKLRESGYNDSAANYEKQYLKEPMDQPYVITHDEFGEFSDYETIELRLYADGTLTDGEDEPVDDDITDMIGEDFASHFGEYEDDAVYIRNDERMVDYEILRDERNYTPRKGVEW
jgi:hypothetical protein